MDALTINRPLHHTHQSIIHSNMTPFVSISILIVALWVLYILMHSITMVIAAGSVAASNSSTLEGNALLENGWWSGESTDTSLNHYVWFGIKCNDGRSAIEIDMARVDLVFYLGDEGDEFSKLNFSSFPNLVPLNVSYYGLRGSIPIEIGTLLKLTHLNLSHYYL